MTPTVGPHATNPPDSAITFLATWPAGSVERRTAAAVVLVSLAFFVVALPFAKQPWPQVWAFIPVYQSALVINDLVTAVLLFGQFKNSRSKAVLVLAGGYLFTACATVAHGLSFPGLFAAGGLMGAGPQSTAWLYMFWHGGFPMFVVAYAILRGSPREALPARWRAGPAIVWAVLAVVVLVMAVTLLATTGHDALPAIMQGNRYTPVMLVVVSTVWGASLFALALLWRRRRMHSVLDLWLMVVLCAWLFDIALSAMFNGGRFDVGFYVGRAYGLLASSFVLGVLLLENGLLHARLMQAHAHEHQRAIDLQALSAKLEDSNHQLQEQTRLKSEFLANMSHELRTPLNAVIGFSDILKEGLTRDATKQRAFAAHIFEAGHHLLALINDILDLSKIEAGKVEIALDPVDMEAALAEVLAMLAQQAQAKGVRLHFESRGGLGVMRADRRRLKQILLNLVSNAMKFTPAGGQVTLHADVVGRSRAATALPGFRDGMRMPLPPEGHDDFIEISVADTGIGIAPDEVGKLFAPFMQVPNLLTRSVEGTGLGLVMVHRLAELHGGTVAVTSAPGRGSCFTVWLPWRADDAGPVSPERPALAPHRARQPLALVVEDNAQAAALMRAQLESQGFAVRVAASAEAALALVGQFTPDLITLDILLPDMDGWEFLARLKQSPPWDLVPVVVVSMVADRGKGYSLGAAAVLQKPIRREALARSLGRLGLEPRGDGPLTVLVIDDDVAAVELLSAQLHQREYTVLRAFGGREGIELARRFQPDLITLDLDMPEVNGFAVVEALQDNAETARIPIMVVTSRDLSAADRRHLSGHVADIVGKSEFSERRFISEVARALARSA